MKILFAVSNEEVSESIVKKYQKQYKEIISYKNVYYFNAILKEIQKDKSYDRIVISEDLEAFAHTQYDQIDRFIFEKLDSISDEASNFKGDDIPIILICSDRRTKSEQMLVKLFGIGVYNALLGTDRSVDELCKLINKPRSKKEAKAYYKIDVDDAVYRPESENDVSEVEIQNILAHYKRLGKNEDKYLESFNNIAAQYSDMQLKVICKFLPLNVRAVLEEKSPKYQQVMAFNAKVSDRLRVKENDNTGTSEKLLKPKIKENIMSKPVVVPSAVNLEKNKKLSKPKQQKQIEPQNVELQEEDFKEFESEEMTTLKENKVKKTEIEDMPVQNITEKEEKQEKTPQPKRRGRPRKNVLPEENNVEQPKKKRGRPKKVVEKVPQLNIEDLEDEVTMPGSDDEEDIDDSISMPGFEEENQEKVQNDEDSFLPGFDNMDEDEEENDFVMPGVEEKTEYEPQNQQYVKQEQTYNSQYEPQYGQQYGEQYRRQEQNFEPVRERPRVDISRLLTSDKKIACFVGTSKNGTSFIVNHVAEVLSMAGINTAILDTTQNRNAYYIYTKNEEDLRIIAKNSFENLLTGTAKGIEVNRNLTVYTSLPDDTDDISNSGKILETLLNKHSVILIDCDFKTDIGYFSDAQEIYLVQSLDVLTIQPLTAFLRELKARGVLDESKLRIVLNKTEKLRGISEKTIIGGMSSYNDPSMSYMVDLFDKTIIKYMSVPFEEEVYVKYLEGLINCNITLKGYPKNFIQILKELGNMVYPQTTGKTPYKPPTVNKSGFSPSINSTLDQMRKY